MAASVGVSTMLTFRSPDDGLTVSEPSGDRQPTLTSTLAYSNIVFPGETSSDGCGWGNRRSEHQSAQRASVGKLKAVRRVGIRESEE
jgi:hypothetical protein